MPDAQMIGPYRLERVLGTGSFATVWLAFDDVLDRKVAVKILADNWSRDNDVRRRFLSEARVLLTVESPRIVRGFHIGESPSGQPYLVMAYADRGTVGDRIEQRRREGRTFDVRETVGIATEVALALADVHASGHLHRDVKPSNVLIRSSAVGQEIPGLAADESVVLGDFGLARGIDLSALTMVAGSPAYVAPEQAAGLTQLDRRADLYPLGRMMVEMLAGDPGGRATTMASAATEEVDVAAMLADVGGRTGAPTGALVQLITRLVAKNPDDRPSSAEEVAAALLAVAGAGPPDAASDDAPPDDAPPGRRRTWGAIAAAALLALAVIAVVVAITRDGDGGGSGTTTTAAPVVAPDTTSSPGTTEPPEPARLVLPVGAFSPDALGTAPSNPDRQEGSILMAADEFAAALVAANPDWAGEPPDANSDGTVDFELVGPGRTASIHIEPAAETSGAVIVAFTIDYA